MSKLPIQAWGFSVVVVKLGRRFLLVHEAKHGRKWYFPAGRLEAGETFEMAALRETREEAGAAIDLEGILRVEWSPGADSSARMRVLFLGRPRDDAPPKSVADSESLEARWFTVDEIEKLDLRGDEVLIVTRAVLAGMPVHPLDVLRPER